MPKYSSVASIRTLWENNPDTSLSAANLSRLQELTASYLNTDLSGTNLHVEGTILFVNPNDSSQLMIKRGTVVQIINEAVDNDGNPIVPKNSQYRVFDVGLEDIILTYTDTDDSHLNKTSWGTGTNQWYVFMCDKDDGSIIKEKVDDYGGGAQVLISKYNNFPRGQVPGRPLNNYSTGDTRLIGGFKTTGNIIISSSVWDIAGKTRNSKAKVYMILDEYKIGGAEYRQIELKDLNTTNANIFNNSVTILGDITVEDITAQDLIINNITSTGTLSQTGQSNFTGSIDVSESVFIGQQLTVTAETYLNDVVEFSSTAKFMDGITDKVVIDNNLMVNIPQYNKALFDLNGNFNQLGNITQVGNVFVGGQNNTVSLTGEIGITGDVEVDGNFTIPSSNGLSTLVSIGQDTQDVNINVNRFYINSPVAIDGELTLNAGNANIAIATTANWLTSTAGYWKHQGNMMVDGSEIEFAIQANNSDKVFLVNTETQQITGNGSVDFILGLTETFTIKDTYGQVILGVENNTPTEKSVAINNVLNVSVPSADNALHVTGNAYISNNLTVDGTLYADVEGDVVGGASFWSAPVNITFTGGATGSFNIQGGEGTITVAIQIVDDSHTHDTRYFTQTQLSSDSGIDVHWNNLSFVPSTFTPIQHDNNYHSETYLRSQDITWSFLDARSLVSSSGGDNGTDELLARADHIHSQYMVQGLVGADDIAFVDYISGSNWSNVDEAINGMWTYNDQIFAKVSDDADFNTLNVNVLNVDSVVTNSISVDNSIETLAGDSGGVTFVAADTFQFIVGTDGQPKIHTYINGTEEGGTRYLVMSDSTNNVAPSAIKLVNSQTFSLNAGTGISLSNGGTKNFNGTTSVDFGQISVNYGGTGIENLAARSDHNHDNTYASTLHTHSTYSNSDELSDANVYSKVSVIDGIVTELTSRSLTYLDVGAAASNHTHDDLYYSKDDVDYRIDYVLGIIEDLHGLESGYYTRP